MLIVEAYEFSQLEAAESSWESFLSNIPTREDFDALNNYWGIYAELAYYNNKWLIIVARDSSTNEPYVAISDGESCSVPDPIARNVVGRLKNMSRSISDYEIRFSRPRKVWLDHEPRYRRQTDMVL